jgi:AcrR family transcriptional regulator
MKLDKRAKRTRAWLLETLLDLLETKDYSEISITELTEKSGIARQTFYGNYDSKDDILLSKMGEILDDYFAKIQISLELKNDPNMEFEMTELVNVWQRNEAIFKALQKAGLAHKALEKLSEYTAIFHMKAQNLQELDDRHQYLVYFIAGGVYMVLNKWFENEMNTSRGILTDLFQKVAKHIYQIADEYIDSSEPSEDVDTLRQ